MYLIDCMSLNRGDVVHGRYEVIDELGRGGFGITYTVYDKQQSSRPIVVLKQIRILQSESNQEERDTDYLERLRLEADTLRNLEHSHIPEFFDSFEEGNYYYIIQEYIEGHNLGKEIFKEEKIKEYQAFLILRTMLEILEFVHSNNIIHRDIKPANIIRRHRDNQLFLIDFGGVKEIATETNISGKHLTRAIVSKGYTPAEQLAGQPELNSDIYALGIMLMQAVTGFSINEICDAQRIPRRDYNCNYVWQKYAPEINSKLKEIISKMIKYNFNNRYQNITEIRNDLEGTTIGVPPEPTIPTKKDHYLIELFKQYRKQIRFLIITIIACLLSVLLFKIAIADKNICSFSLEDNISCGEEILNPLSKGAIRDKAAEKYGAKKYSEATYYFQQSWQKERRDAETLIYLNNSLLDANKIDHYTIAVAVPLSSNPDNKIKSSEISQDFLRGIAQAQTEVNLNLSKTNPEIKNKLSSYNFLPYRSISQIKNKGLKVIIANDGNNKQQAKEVATEIAQKKRILGIIGHYTSSRTLDTVDIYNQKKLAQISYGTTTKELTENPQSNFFRVVYSNEEESDALVKYIEQNDLLDKKIAIFYNPSSEYSNRLKIELETKINNLENPNIKILKKFDLADTDNFSVTYALKQLDKLGINICLLLPDGLVSNSLAEAIDVLEEDNGKRLMLGANVIINYEVNQIETEQPLNLIASTFWHPTANLESTFNQQTKQLWGTRVNGGTAMAYDATLALLEAIKRQHKPTRQGTIKQLSDANFSVTKAATGEIKFNTPKNGDRLNFHPTLVRLYKCQDETNHFVTLALDDIQASNFVCQSEN